MKTLHINSMDDFTKDINGVIRFESDTQYIVSKPLRWPVNNKITGEISPIGKINKLTRCIRIANQ